MQIGFWGRIISGHNSNAIFSVNPKENGAEKVLQTYWLNPRTVYLA